MNTSRLVLAWWLPIQGGGEVRSGSHPGLSSYQQSDARQRRVIRQWTGDFTIFRGYIGLVMTMWWPPGDDQASGNCSLCSLLSPFSLYLWTSKTKEKFHFLIGFVTQIIFGNVVKLDKIMKTCPLMASCYPHTWDRESTPSSTNVTAGKSGDIWYHYNVKALHFVFWLKPMRVFCFNLYPGL